MNRVKYDSRLSITKISHYPQQKIRDVPDIEVGDYSLVGRDTDTNTTIPSIDLGFYNPIASFYYGTSS
jgi:hypothetical protein